jgi:hypothetical protein
MVKEEKKNLLMEVYEEKTISIFKVFTGLWFEG